MIIDVLVGLAGLALVAAVLNGAVRTTLTLRSSDAITNAVNGAVWKLALFLRRLTNSRQPVQGVGVAALLSVIGVWTLLYWLGWLLFFLPFEGAVLEADSGEAAGFWSRAYFVGFSLITLGVGDYVPGGAVFQMATVLASATGFFLLTLAITYLVPVVTAVVEARRLAAQLFLAGGSPIEVACTIAQAPDRFRFIVQSATPELLLLSQRYFAYSVLRYFASNSRETSIHVAVVVLDEALSIVLTLTRERLGELEPILETLRRATDQHLRATESAFLEPAEEAPPPPDGAELRSKGLTAASDTAIAAAYAALARRRRLLLAMLRHDVREWNEVERAH